MNLKSAKRTLTKLGVAVISISLFITKTEAQSIGHLGVSTDPIPLVQAKRPQPKYLARRVNRPDPNSKTLLAEVGDGGGKSSPVAPKNSVNNSGKISGTIDVVELPKNPPPANSSSNAKPAPIRPAEPTADDFLAKAADFVVKGDAQAAAESFRAALKLKPDSLDAQLGLADAMFDLKDYAGADAEYQKIIAQNSSSAEARRGRADTLYELKKYDEAAKEYQAAIQHGATDAGVYNNFANALFRTGTRENRDRAIENYRQAIAKQPTWPDAYAGMANVLRVQKRLD
ncbi:MAG TPA: tetratricopeptide repeat protein, partial [Blastocatellia bacterium]|nr:tetratricopeptide repeat protein [Blastocatellia bacterium]